MRLNRGLGSIICHTVVNMEQTGPPAIFELSAFLSDTVYVRIRVPDADEVSCVHMVSVAQRFGYFRLNRPDNKCVVPRTWRSRQAGQARRILYAGAATIAELNY